jgi:hypothetical protein
MSQKLNSTIAVIGIDIGKDLAKRKQYQLLSSIY